MKLFKGYKDIMKLVLVGIILLFLASTYDISADAAANTDNANPGTYKTEAPQIQPVTKRIVNQVTNQFMDVLVQKADEQYKVMNMDSKQELLQQFSNIATNKAAIKFVDYYYDEKPDGLYILPTETPPWLQDGQDYQIKKEDAKHYKVTQENTTALYGHYTIQFHFSWIQDKWKISSVAYDS